ncbi:MAG: transposase [Bacteroidota bacterium]
MKTRKGKKAYFERKTTVEPAIGTLQQHMGLRFINVRGKSSAHKVIVMAACAYNLRKWVKAIMKPAKTEKMALNKALISRFEVLLDIWSWCRQTVKTLAFHTSVSD